jgi:hypothetical protein
MVAGSFRGVFTSDANSYLRFCKYETQLGCKPTAPCQIQRQCLLFQHGHCLVELRECNRLLVPELGQRIMHTEQHARASA